MTPAKLSRAHISDLRDHLGFWLRFVSNHVSHNFAKRLLETGVTTAEWVVLRAMYDDEEQSASALADRLGMTRGAVSKLLDRLAGKKLLTVRTNPEDRRFQVLALTSAGRKLVPVMAALADQNDAEAFRPLSAKERDLLLATLKKLVKAHELHRLPTE